MSIPDYIAAIFSEAVWLEIVNIFTLASPLFVFTAPFLIIAVIRWVFSAVSGSDNHK